MDLSLDQQRAIAMAKARMAASQAEQPSTAPAAQQYRQPSIVPLARDPVSGNIEFAMPKVVTAIPDIARGIYNGVSSALTAPGDAYTGKLQVMGPDGNVTPEAIGRGVDFASTFLPGMAGGGGAAKALVAPQDALSGLSGAAQRYVGEISSPDKIGALRDALVRLGPDATLADVSPEWMGVARGAASQPGNRDAIVQPLLDRSAGANQRLSADLDASLGPAVIPSQVEAGLADSRNAVAQQYQPVMANATAVNTQPLADAIDAATANLRGPEQQAVQRVRGYLNIPGTDVLDPNPQALHATREAIDGLMASEQNPKVIRQLTMARQQVDQELARSAPGIKDVDAQYAELARQSEALQQGRPILNNGVTALRPQEVEDMLMQGALPQGAQIGPSGVPTRMQQSVRAEIDRAAGTNAIDTTALRNIVRGEGDWNRQKLASLFGQENADQALNAIDRETTFGQTANRVTSGSDTAMANRFGDFLDDAASPHEVPADLTWLGVAAKTGKKALSAILQQNADAKASRYAGELGGMSVANGDARDRLIASMIQRAQAQPKNPAAIALAQAAVLAAENQRRSGGGGW